MPKNETCVDLSWDELNGGLGAIGGIEGLLMMGPGLLGLPVETVERLGKLAETRAPIDAQATIAGHTYRVRIR